MDKDVVCVYTHTYTDNGVLPLSHKKEGNFAIFNNTDELGEYYVK